MTIDSSRSMPLGIEMFHRTVHSLAFGALLAYFDNTIINKNDLAKMGTYPVIYGALSIMDIALNRLFPVKSVLLKGGKLLCGIAFGLYLGSHLGVSTRISQLYIAMGYLVSNVTLGYIQRDYNRPRIVPVNVNLRSPLIT